MSWGERSCKGCNGRCKPTFETCNVSCEFYESNGLEPDSIPEEFIYENTSSFLGKSRKPPILRAKPKRKKHIKRPKKRKGKQ